MEVSSLENGESPSSLDGLDIMDYPHLEIRMMTGGSLSWRNGNPHIIMSHVINHH